MGAGWRRGGPSGGVPQAASRKPQAASRKPQAASRKPQAASRKPREAGPLLRDMARGDEALDPVRHDRRWGRRLYDNLLCLGGR